MTSENKINLNRTVICYRGRDLGRCLQEWTSFLFLNKSVSCQC